MPILKEGKYSPNEVIKIIGKEKMAKVKHVIKKLTGKITREKKLIFIDRMKEGPGDLIIHCDKCNEKYSFPVPIVLDMLEKQLKYFKKVHKHAN